MRVRACVFACVGEREREWVWVGWWVREREGDVGGQKARISLRLKSSKKNLRFKKKTIRNHLWQKKSAPKHRKTELFFGRSEFGKKIGNGKTKKSHERIFFFQQKIFAVIFEANMTY